MAAKVWRLFQVHGFAQAFISMMVIVEDLLQ
jgi:hypothetical protein